MENKSSSSSTPTINPSPFLQPPPFYYSFPPPTYQFPSPSSPSIVDGNPRAASSMTWPNFLPRWALPFLPRWPPSIESQSPSIPTSAMPMLPQLPFNWHHVNSSQLRPSVITTTASTPHLNPNLGGAIVTSLKDPMHGLHVEGKPNRHKQSQSIGASPAFASGTQESCTPMGAAPGDGSKINILHQAASVCDHPIDRVYPKGMHPSNFLL